MSNETKQAETTDHKRTTVYLNESDTHEVQRRLVGTGENLSSLVRKLLKDWLNS